LKGTFQELEAGVARIVKKVNDLPLEQIAADLHTDLNDLSRNLERASHPGAASAVDTLSALHRTLDSANHTLDVESPLQRSLAETLSETRGTLQAVRECRLSRSSSGRAVAREATAEMPQGPARRIYGGQTVNGRCLRFALAWLVSIGVGCSSAPVRYYTLTRRPTRPCRLRRQPSRSMCGWSIPAATQPSELMVRTGPADGDASRE